MQNYSEELRKLHEEIGSLRKTFSKKECLHPEAPHNCKGGIVKAHTIQRSGGLSKIAEDRHVLAPDAYSDPTVMKTIGINRASTFTGFCMFHDDQLFAPIEKHTLQLNRRHAFLLAYRGITKELYLKKRVVEHVATDDAPYPSIWLDHQAGAKVALLDLQPIQQDMGNAIVTGSFRDTNYYAIEFDSVPDILCSGAVNIEYDFHAIRLQYLTSSEPIEYTTFSLLPYGDGGGVAIFAWFGKSNVNKKFIRSISSLPVSDIPDAIVRFAFQHFENMFLAPNWWERLSDNVREALLKRYDSTFSIDGYTLIDLRPDGYNYVNWKVVGKPKTNVKL